MIGAIRFCSNLSNRFDNHRNLGTNSWMMRVIILSDTHIPSRSRTLPKWVQNKISAADHVIHAGDFDSVDTYERLVSLTNGNLTAVKGNTDPAELDLPTVTTVDINGITFVVTHDIEGASNCLRESSNTVLEHGGSDAIGVTGHTHTPKDKVVDGTRILNPGSATGVKSADMNTVFLVTVTDEAMHVRLIAKPRTIFQRITGIWSRLLSLKR